LSDENYGAAIANFDKALKISPDNLEALRMKAEATMDGGDLVAAAECFGELLKRKPNDFDALFGIGKLHCQLADESAEPDEERYKALNYLLAAEEQKPDSAPLHQRLASLHEAMGDQEEADRHRAIARRLRKRKP
jgi:tetratricopeptide (TPR) repeat protein